MGRGIHALLIALALGGCGGAATVTSTSPASGPVPGTSGPGGGTGSTPVTSTPADRGGPAATTSTATTSTATTATSSTPTTATPTTPGQPITHLATFRSPSGNIGCMIVSEVARCDIRHRSWSPPSRPADCPSEVDYGQGLAVGRSGAGHLVCAGDTVFDPGAPVLPYGTDSVRETFTCQSRTSGMTCYEDATRHGFFISIEGYRTF